MPLPRSPAAAATEWLPLAVGNSWTLADRAGTLEIRVARREPYGGRDCFVVEWTSEGKTYQSEHWYTDSDGIWVAARHVGEQAVSLDRPWPFLKSPLGAGSEWEATFTGTARGFPSKRLALAIRAEADERVEVPAGSYAALRVDYREGAGTYRRWFARGVGLVREDLYVGTKLGNSKRLVAAKIVPASGGAPAAVGGPAEVDADGFERIPEPAPLDADLREVDSTASSAALAAYRATLSSPKGGVFSARATGSFLEEGADEVVLEMPAAAGGAELVVMRRGASGYAPALRTRVFQKIEFKRDLPLGPRRRVMYLCATTSEEPLKRRICGFLGQGSFRDVSDVSKPDATRSDLLTVDPTTCGEHQSVHFQRVAISSGRVVVSAFTQPKKGTRLPASEQTKSPKGSTACRWVLERVTPHAIEYGLRSGKLERITPPIAELDAIVAR